MVASNLLFFDKNGDSFNLKQDSNGVWQGKNYVRDTSIALFDTINIFVLEQTEVSPQQHFAFPVLSANQMILVKWKTLDNADNLFLYTVKTDPFNNNIPFIARQEKLEIKHSDFNVIGALDIAYPLQINIAFTPFEEIAYTRILQIFSANEDGTGQVLLAEMEMYGEGTGEDERFKVWLNNFGIRFNQDDALILKDYDLKEAMPDWKSINQARKELLVNRDQVFPYVGTYKGLVNIINLLGFKDTLLVKEYWRNINKLSPYFDKMAMVDITSLLNTGTIDSLNLITLDKDIKDSSQFVKTSFLALVYEFTKTDGTADEEGLPNVVETTEFTPDEIFFKLHKLVGKLKDQFLPANVLIKDIIGEFIYFQRIRVKYWTDLTTIYDSSINFHFPFDVITPNQDAYELVLQDIKSLFRTSGTNQFPITCFNVDNNANPYEFAQKYPLTQFNSICTSYENFYNSYINNSFINHGHKPEWQASDDDTNPVGCPVIFQLEIPEIRLEDLSGITIQELSKEPMTIADGRFVDMHEIEWTITKPGPNPYYFTYRGIAKYLYRLPHILPYTGTYLVEAIIHDFFGGKSHHYQRVIVNQTNPQILALARLNDKFEYRLSDLANLQIKDMAGSYIFNPNANILDNENVYQTINVDSNVLDMWEYLHEFGIGRNMFNVEILDENSNTFKAYDDPTLINQYARWWGVAQGQSGMRLKDLDGVRIKDMFHTKIYQNVWCWDFLNGFYLEKPKPHSHIIIGGYAPYTVPHYDTIEELRQFLSETDHPALSQYNFSLVNGRIHAQAKYHSKQLHHKVSITENWANPLSPWISPYISPGTEATSKYTFIEPIWAYSPEFITHMVNKFPTMDRETLFLSAPTSDITSGLVSDPQYWINKKSLKYNADKTEQTGFLKSVMDESSLSMSQLKITDNQLTIPKYLSVFFMLNSVWGKIETTWNLKKINSDNSLLNIITVKGGPFFIFRFPLYGSYLLTASVRDNNGNIHEIEFDPIVKVVKSSDYIGYVEGSLDERMVNILKNQ